MPITLRFSLTDQAIDITSLTAELHDPAAGAEVTFDGRVRNSNDGRLVSGLEYQTRDQTANELSVGNLDVARPPGSAEPQLGEDQEPRPYCRGGEWKAGESPLPALLTYPSLRGATVRSRLLTQARPGHVGQRAA
jgi:hypothetical protein